MNSIIKIYKVGSYGNLFAVIIFTGLFLFDMLTIGGANSLEDMLAYFGFLAIAAFYCYCFYLHTLLISNIPGLIKKISMRLRVFFVIELLLAVPYTVLVLFSFTNFNFNFEFRNWSDLERLILLLCMYGAYAGSIVRLVFSKKLLRHFLKNEDDLLMDFGSGS